MEKILDYLEIFKTGSPRKKFIFGLIIYCDASREELGTALAQELPKATFTSDNSSDDTDSEAVIIEAVESGKIVIAETSKKMSDRLLKYLLAIDKREPGLNYEKIDNGSLILKIHANNYKDLEIGEFAFYTCNLLRN